MNKAFNTFELVYHYSLL